MVLNWLQVSEVDVRLDSIGFHADIRGLFNDSNQAKS